MEFLLEPEQLGPWQLTTRLGKGASSVVYRACHEVSGIVGAAKVLTGINLEGARLDRFHREADLAARLRHPHIVTALDAGQEGPYHYLIYDFVDGEDLGKVLRCHPRLPEAAVLTVGRHVASALCAIHEHHMVHRDIKPENILIDRSGRAMLADLGLSKDLTEPTLTVTEQIMGTPYYMAPEQAQSSKHVDHRADIYSLGATLYHCLSGEEPFKGDSALAVLQRHVSEPVRPLRTLRGTLDPELCGIIEKSLAKGRSERYQTPQALLNGLDAYAAERGIEVFPLETLLRPANAEAAGTVVLEGAGHAGNRTSAKEAEPPAAEPKTPPRSHDEGEAPPPAPRRSTPVPPLVSVGSNARRRKALTWSGPLLVLLLIIAVVFVRNHVMQKDPETPPSRPKTISTAKRTEPLAQVLQPAPGASQHATLGLPTIVSSARDGSTLVLIPGGRFRMGYGEATEAVSGPAHTVNVDAYYLGRTEVTNEQFTTFVRETNHPGRPSTWSSADPPYPGDRRRHPATGVSWSDARAYAHWAGLRLPRECEWEFAARGDDERLFPWGGTQWEPRRAQDPAALGFVPGGTEGLSAWRARFRASPQGNETFDRCGATVPVDDFPAGAGPFGCLNLAGNVAEWIDGELRPYPGSTPPPYLMPLDPPLRLVRGNSWWSHPPTTYVTILRWGAAPEGRFDIGFRIAADARRVD